MLETVLTVASNGWIVIPAKMRGALGIQGGDKILARVVDGAIVLEPVDTAIRRAQAMVGRYVAADAGLADELIAERHEAGRND